MLTGSVGALPRGSEDSAPKVRLFGQAESAEAYAIRDFLMRSVVEFEWIELTCDDDCHEQLGLPEIANVRLPVVELPDRTRLFAPPLREIADRLGWVTQPRLREYDLSIYGAGPAGLSAAVYAASEGLRVVLIERHAVGGQAGSSSMIENYMGFPLGISGADLAERARQQAVKFGCELLMMREGIKAEFRNNRIYVDMADGSKMVAHANICATGVEWRRLSLLDEHRFLGVGLYYGAGASEAPMCGGEHVYVVGGGNSAGQAVMHLAEHAARVTMLVLGPDLASSLSTYLIDRIERTPNVEVVYNVEVVGLDGEEGLRRVELMDGESGNRRWVDARRLFVCIGGVPHTEWARETGINSVKRVASAVGEGAMAVTFARRYLAETA
jgi:thioredoxin reductase (NADPH)